MSERLFEVLQRASLFLESYQKEKQVAQLLLQYHLNVTREQFFMKLRDPIQNKDLIQFEIDLQKHAKTGVPIQHLTGVETFYDRSFTVTNDVLIPRPETEEVVKYALSKIKEQERSKEVGDSKISVVDVGTGSGIIGITLKLELPQINLKAIDISVKALKIAKENAENLNAEIEFLEGSFLEPLIKRKMKVDCIVSNPPYIAYEDLPSLSDTVRNFDPEQALFANENGLYAYRKILEQAPSVLNSGGVLVFEIGSKQSTAVTELARTVFVDAEIQTIKDINQNDRVVVIQTIK